MLDVLGFSVYLGNALDKEYILNMASMGYDVIFTSLQIPEENKQHQLSYFGNYVSFFHHIISLISLMLILLYLIQRFTVI